jgi:ribonuclease HI
MNYTAQFDGSCGPINPGGTGRYGSALFEEGQQDPIQTQYGCLGKGPHMSNNFAEFYGAWYAMMMFYAQVHGTTGCILTCYGDSKLVVNIINNRWKADPNKLYYHAYDSCNKLRNTLIKEGHTVHFIWIPRDNNTLCDELSKRTT